MRRALLTVYPFLFACYPILALAVHNIIYIDPGAVARSLLIAVLITGLIWIAARLIAKDWGRAGVVTVWTLVLFFSYGHVYLQLQNSLGEAVRHRYLAGAYAAVFILGALWILVKLKDHSALQNAIVTFSCILTGTAIIQWTAYELSVNRLSVAAIPANVGSGMGGAQTLPDIYWILLDGHTRSDILRRDFDYDNSAFLRDLEDMGFYVAKCSQSNYPSTRYSVTSLMNANYLDQLPGVTRGIPPLKRSLVYQTVRSLGYTVIAFENQSTGHFDLGEDMRLARNQLALGSIDLLGGLNEFEFMLMQTSALRLIYDMPQLIPGLDPQILAESEYYEHYQQTLFILDKLPDLPKTRGPRFVFAHILVPHPPYIFAPDGSFYWANDRDTGYISNVQFIDARIADTARKIIENSKTPPIIIVQGDHGPFGERVTPEMRMSILNAYYLNEESKRDLYGSITPVNSFRIIFNHYFGTDYPLLEDKSYFAYYEWQFSSEYLVPNACAEP